MESHFLAGWHSCINHVITCLARPTTPTQGDRGPTSYIDRGRGIGRTASPIIPSNLATTTSLESFPDHQQKIRLSYNAPILKLNVDVLGYIFLLISSMDSEQPVAWTRRPYPMRECAYNGVRYSAQTCRPWRILALESSTLWANVVDLDGLQQAKDEWREEFMKRTGNSLLSVRGYVDEDDISFVAFFKSLLNNNWGRMRIFNVNSGMCSPQGFSVLWRRAEYLESFELRHFRKSHQHHALEMNSVSQTLFADEAPRLRHFHYYSGGISFSLHAPWMKQLHSLSISSPFTVCQILHALAQLPLLESVELRTWSNDVGPNPPTSPRRIHLPHLRKILVIGDFQNIVAVLSPIFPPPGCALSLTAYNYELSNSGMELHKIVEKFWKSYSASTEVTKFSVYIGDGRYCLTRAATSRFHDEPPKFFLFLHFSPSIPPSYHSLFFHTLSPAKPMHIKELDFCQHNFETLDPLDPTMVSFVSSQESVESLIATDCFLMVLFKIASVHSIPFPRLHSLKFRFSFRIPTSVLPPSLIDFLSSRSKANVQISVVDLTEQRHLKSEDLRCLDGMDGLKVLLRGRENSDERKVLEYLCGHGLVGDA